MKRSLSISRALGNVVVTLHGHVDAQVLSRTLVDLIENQGNLHLIIDLGDAAYLDEETVSILVGSSVRTRRRGGELILSGPVPAIQWTTDHRQPG